MKCPNCGSGYEEHTWSLSVKSSSFGSLGTPILVLGCEECSETLRILDDNDLANLRGEVGEFIDAREGLLAMLTKGMQ